MFSALEQISMGGNVATPRQATRDRLSVWVDHPPSSSRSFASWSEQLISELQICICSVCLSHIPFLNNSRIFLAQWDNLAVSMDLLTSALSEMLHSMNSTVCQFILVFWVDFFRVFPSPAQWLRFPFHEFCLVLFGFYHLFFLCCGGFSLIFWSYCWCLVGL